MHALAIEGSKWFVSKVVSPTISQGVTHRSSSDLAGASWCLGLRQHSADASALHDSRDALSRGAGGAAVCSPGGCDQQLQDELVGVIGWEWARWCFGKNGSLGGLEWTFPNTSEFPIKVGHYSKFFHFVGWGRCGLITCCCIEWECDMTSDGRCLWQSLFFLTAPPWCLHLGKL